MGSSLKSREKTSFHAGAKLTEPFGAEFDWCAASFFAFLSTIEARNSEFEVPRRLEGLTTIESCW